MNLVDYPPSLSLAQLPTPLQPLDRLRKKTGGPRIWIKRDDLTGCATSGNKIRKLEFTLANALAQGCDTVITCGGIQSNHCRTTALLGAQLGLTVHLVLRGEKRGEKRGENPNEPADGNLLLDELAGAHISYYAPVDYQRNLEELMVQWLRHYEDQGRKVCLIPTGASDGIGVWGYIRCCEELAADFLQHDIKPRHIISATGSGGTQAGLTAGNVLHELSAEVWGINVCDDENYFLQKVRADLRDWQQRYNQSLNVDELDIHVIDGYVGPGYAKATKDIFQTIRLLAKLEGILLDPVYSGKAFHGLLEEIKKGRFSDSDDIVFIHTGGLFGLLAQRTELDLSRNETC